MSPGVYLGASSNIPRRWNSHRNALRRNRHRNVHLQRAWNKYGEAAFEFKTVWLCEPLEAFQFEREMLQSMVGDSACYNTVIDSSRPSFGRKLSAIHKARIGQSNSIALLGHHLSEDRRRKLSIALKGKHHYPSEEARKRMSLAKLGKPAPHNRHPKTEEVRHKISIAKTGVPWSVARWAAFHRTHP